MKAKPLKILVLLFSLSAASIYVWHASRTKPAQTTQPSAASGEPAARNDFAEPMPARAVNEEEVRKVRETMLRSSKSGMIMDDDAIRRILESRPSPQSGNPAQEGALMGSSKRIEAIFTSEDLKTLINVSEEREKAPDLQKNVQIQPGAMMGSTKNPARIIRFEDVNQLLGPKTKPEEKTNEPSAEEPRP